jgi:uncharacterized protein (TIGR02646 family)
MIRVFKTEEIPASLQEPNCNRYDGQDVQDTLVANQHRKCYLCEQDAGKDFQIEHLKPKAKGYYPELEFKWENLFLACPYCNGRKPNSALILDPSQNNMEEIIAQRLDGKEICFTSTAQDEATQKTIGLLSRLFNGVNHLRDVKCQQLFKDVEQEISCFFELLVNYKNNRSEENKQALNDSLKIDKEFLGFKYWIIKDFGFYEEFKDFVRWNKIF